MGLYDIVEYRGVYMKRYTYCTLRAVGGLTLYIERYKTFEEYMYNSPTRPCSLLIEAVVGPEVLRTYTKRWVKRFREVRVHEILSKYPIDSVTHEGAEPERPLI